MQVTEITARFVRKVQMRDYEPAEAEITLKAHLSDADINYAEVGTAILKQARDMVIATLRGETSKTAGETITSVEAVIVNKPEKKSTKKTESKKTETTSSNSELPDDVTDTKKTETTAASSELPDEIVEAKKVEEITNEELQKFVADLIEKKLIDSKTIKETYSKFEAVGGGRANRIMDIKPEDRAKLKASLNALKKQ